MFEEAGEGGATEGFAVLPEHADLDALHRALGLLGQAGATPSQPPLEQQQQKPRPMAERQASLGKIAPASAAASSGDSASARAAGPAQPAEKRPRNTQAGLA